MRDRIYHWLMMNLHYRITHHKIWFDGHQIWWPRWGHSKRQKEEASKRADQWMKDLKWDQ